MPRLKVELIGRLGGDELHGRPLHGFRNRLGIVAVVLLALRIGDLIGPRGRAQHLGHDVAREVIEDGQEVEPSPAKDLEVGQVRLPELI